MVNWNDPMIRMFQAVGLKSPGLVCVLGLMFCAPGTPLAHAWWPTAHVKMAPAAVVKRVHGTHARIDGVYRFEPNLAAGRVKNPDHELIEFANDRARACVQLTADLMLTAWRDSEAIKLPRWHDRNPN